MGTLIVSTAKALQECRTQTHSCVCSCTPKYGLEQHCAELSMARFLPAQLYVSPSCSARVRQRPGCIFISILLQCV